MALKRGRGPLATFSPLLESYRRQARNARQHRKKRKTAPARWRNLTNSVGILLKPIRTNTMIGKSLNRGANAAGKVARHPRVRVSDMRYVWKGPGCTTAAKAYVNPKTR